MAKTFEIEIEELLQRVVKVKANSLSEAIDKVEERYSNQQYVLDSEDFKGVEFREYKDEVIKQKQKHKNHMER